MIYRNIYLPDDIRQEAKDFVINVIDNLYNQNRLSQLDSASLYIVADAFSNYLNARDIVQKEGLVITNNLGNAIIHPAQKVAKDAQVSVLNFAKEMGLSLKSRKAIISLAQETEKSPLELFMQQNLDDED